MFGLIMLAALAVSAAAVIGGHPARVEAQTAVHLLSVKPKEENQSGQDLDIARITSSPAGIDCGKGSTQKCSADFPAGTSITLAGDIFGSPGVSFHWWHPVIYTPTSGKYVEGNMFCKEFEGSDGASPGNNCTGIMPNTNVTINFTATPPQTQTQTPANKSSSGSGAAASQNTTQSHGEVKGAQTSKKSPDKPKVAVEVDGRTVGNDEKVALESGDSLKLSGQTVPYGKVTLYLFSKPRTFETTADQMGNWEYTIADIPAGEHHIEAEVTDPATEKTSERTQVVALSVDRINQIAPSSDDSPVMQKSPIMAIVIGAVITAIAAAIFVILTLAIWHPSTLRKWRKRFIKSPKRLRHKR
jgi:hypothetical protein